MVLSSDQESAAALISAVEEAANAAAKQRIAEAERRAEQATERATVAEESLALLVKSVEAAHKELRVKVEAADARAAKAQAEADARAEKRIEAAEKKTAKAQAQAEARATAAEAAAAAVAQRIAEREDRTAEERVAAAEKRATEASEAAERRAQDAEVVAASVAQRAAAVEDAVAQRRIIAAEESVQQHAAALEEVAAAAARRAAAAEEEATQAIEEAQAVGHSRLVRMAAGDEERSTLRCRVLIDLVERMEDELHEMAEEEGSAVGLAYAAFGRTLVAVFLCVSQSPPGRAAELTRPHRCASQERGASQGVAPRPGGLRSRHARRRRDLLPHGGYTPPHHCPQALSVADPHTQPSSGPAATLCSCDWHRRCSARCI